MLGRKKIRLLTMLFGVILICFGLGIFFNGARNGWNFGFGRNTIVADDTKESDIKDTKEILIDIPSGELNIIAEDRENIKVVLSGSITSSSELKQPELTLSKTSNKINIGMKSQKTYLGFTSINLKVDVFIPKNFTESLTLNTSSGDINMKDKMTLNNVSFSLSSGDLNITDLTCNDFEYECSSGSLEASTLNTKNTKLHSSSGDIDIDSFTGNLDGESSSGKITIAYSSFNNNVKLHASSGDINLKLPESAEFYVKAQCSSGDVECDFPVTTTGKQKKNSLEGTVKSGDNKVVLDTSSGDINISN